MLLPASFRTTDPLSNLSVKFMNDQTKYAALKVLTPFLVAKNVFKWYIYGKENLKLDVLDAPSGSVSKRFDWSAATATSTAKEFAARFLVLEKDARDFDTPVADLRTDAAQNGAEKMLIHMEAAAYTKLATSGNYASGLSTASGGWDVDATDILGEIRTGRQAVFEACGMRPTKLAINQKALDLAKLHPTVVDRIKYIGVTDPGAAARALASLFEVDEIVVSDVLKNTANDGATDVLASIWGASALLYVPVNGGLRSNGLGRTFIVNDFSTKSIPRPELARGNLGAEDIESSWEWSQEFIAQDGSGKALAGYLLTSIYS